MRNKLYERAIDRIRYEIRQQTEEPFVVYLMSRRQKGLITDDDLIEIKGYRKGLSVAREILERVAMEECEREGWADDGTVCEECDNRECPINRKRM